MLARFWSQPSRPYRDFQIAFWLLGLHFFFPALSYAFAPGIAAEQFSTIGELLGAGPYAAPEAESRIWRYLASANVMSLALMCFMLASNLRRFWPVLPALVFLKGYNASLFLLDFVVHRYAPFLAVALWDLSNCAMFVFFARRAHRDIAGRADAVLVPRPR